MGDFLMPSLGADMEVGTVLEWRVEAGSTVHRGDIVAVVQTDKSDIEVEAFEDGTIDELLVPPGRSVQVGTPLARIVADGDQPTGTDRGDDTGTDDGTADEPDDEPDDVVATPGLATLDPATTDTAPARAVATGSEPVRASPRARRLARERGVALASVTGSGPDGAVVAADLEGRPPERPVPSADAGPERGEADRSVAMRRSLAELMARSARDIPHYHLSTTIDLGVALDWLARHNADRPPSRRVLPAVLLLRATARAAAEVPGFNGWWRDDALQPAESVDLGVAVSLRGGGLVAPVIRSAEELDVDATMAALRRVVEGARSGSLRSGDAGTPSITVTNLGDRGADQVHGVISSPQVALVGFGRIRERPWAVDGMLTVRATVHASLAGDHRATSGHEGSLFLDRLATALASPEDL
jgi:pyruvate dehydrogenase E2 component (dihydrolipoamide acetyltransferase)